MDTENLKTIIQSNRFLAYVCMHTYEQGFSVILHV